MKSFIFAIFKIFIFTVNLCWGSSAAAQIATLKINSDLIVHPSQVSKVFMISADQANRAATWDWSDIEFQSPYKTWWTGVQAKGPFTLNVHSEDLSKQELFFELYWANPSITVNQFNIKDTVVKDLGGAKVVINFSGSCNNLNWKVNNGMWKVRGRLTWAIVNQELVVRWNDFEFVNNAGVAPTTDMGQCQGPKEVQEGVLANINAVTGNQGALQELLRRGILDWMNNSLRTFKTELMKSRSSNVKPGMDLLWEPQFMVTLPGGLIRVPGYMTVRKEGESRFPMVVDRTLPEAEYASITEMGYIFPTNAINYLAQFTYETGELIHRYKSTEIKSFQDLMNNRSNQGYVWPDLQQFPTTALFYFDLMATAVPKLSNLTQGTSKTGGGISYDTESPVLINDLAPARSKYLNYVDFTSVAKGLLQLTVKNQQLNMKLQASSVPLKAKFRTEFKSYRAVNEKIDTERLGTAGKDFINGNSKSVNLPVWNLGPQMKMIYGDLKLFKQSVMLPMTIEKAN